MSRELRNRLDNIREIASLVDSGGDLDTVLEQVGFAICSHSAWRAVSVLAADRSSGYSELVMRHDPRLEPDVKLPTRWSLAHSPTRRVIESNQPLIIPQAKQSREFPRFREDAQSRDYETAVLLPLRASDLRGREMVLSVYSDESVEVTDDELSFLLTIARLASIAVGKAKTLQAEQDFNTRLRLAVEIHSDLMERVLSGCPSETLVGAIEARLPEPLLVLDLTTDSFFVSRSPNEDSLSAREWESLVRQPELARLLTGIVQRSRPTDFKLIQQLDLDEWNLGHVDAIVEPLLVESETVGGLILFPQKGKQDHVDTLIAQAAKSALSAQLMRGHVQFLSEASAHAELFDRLFEQSWKDLQQIHSRASRMGIDLETEARLAVIGTDPADGQHTHHLHRMLDRAVRELSTGSIVVQHHADYFIYLPDAQVFEEGFEERFSTRVGKVFQWATRNRPIVAFGGTCRRPEDFAPAREQCLRVLSIARTFGRSGLVRQKDFGPYALLMPALDDQTMRAFINDTLGAVAQYETRQSHSLLETMSVYIDMGCRLQATSDSLGVHVSTLRYRLQRLQDMFDIDLNDPETRFSIALALRLKGMMEDQSSR